MGGRGVTGLAGMDDRGAGGLQGGGGWWPVFLLACFLGGWSVPAHSAVTVTTADNATYYFADSEAAFGGVIPSKGIVGILHVATPLKACEPLLNMDFGDELPSFVLVERGICTFATKVCHAQNAGFAAVIVYNDLGGQELITMSGRETKDLYIPAVFVTNRAGHQLLALILDKPGSTVLILPNFENAAWSLMVVTFVSLLVVAAILATFYVIRRHRLQHIGARNLRDNNGMTPGEVKALPSIVFKAGAPGKGTSETCAICLDDYENGDKLRVLPCDHEFHSACIDQWLTRKPFCPVCKRDAHRSDAQLPASERTPLLSDIAREPVGGDAGEDLVANVPPADMSARAAESV